VYLLYLSFSPFFASSSDFFLFSFFFLSSFCVCVFPPPLSLLSERVIHWVYEFMARGCLGKDSIVTEQFSQTVDLTLLTNTREVPRSNLSWDTDNTDGGFIVVSFSLLRQILEYSLKLGPAAFFHIRSSSLFTIKVRVRVTLRLAYRQSVRLGDKLLETHDQ
jgi:hypothetical protein